MKHRQIQYLEKRDTKVHVRGCRVSYVPLPRLWLRLNWPSGSGEPQRQLWLVGHILSLAASPSAQRRCQLIVVACVGKCRAAAQLHWHDWRVAHALRLCAQHSLLHPGTHVCTDTPDSRLASHSTSKSYATLLLHHWDVLMTVSVQQILFKAKL